MFYLEVFCGQTVAARFEEENRVKWRFLFAVEEGKNRQV